MRIVVLKDTLRNLDHAVTAVYLAWSFLSGDWHITWVVWPVAGVFWGVIAGILSLVRRSRSKS